MKAAIPLGLAFLSVACGVWVNIPIASADENHPPTVVSVVVATTANGQTDGFSGGSIDLSAGTTRAVYVNGVVEDLDGKATISSVSGTFHRSGAPSGDNCSADAANCYVVGACALGDNENMNQKTFSCRMDLLHIAESTSSSGRYPAENWVAYVYVSDSLSFATNNATTKEMNALLSVDVPVSFDYGLRNFNDQSTSANNVEMPITQMGNVQTDLEVSMGGNFVCASGFIPRANIKWAITDVGYSDNASHSLTASPVDTNIFVGYGTAGTPAPVKLLYWNIGIPSEGLAGSCTGTVSITAIAH